MKKFTILSIFLAIALVFSSCVPPATGGPEAGNSKETEAETAPADYSECELKISFAISNYENRDWAGTVRNYNEVINLGCGRAFHEDIYQWAGRACIEMSKLDSALYFFRKGLEYDPNNIEIMEVTAYTYGRAGDVDGQVNMLEQILELDAANVEIIEKLSDLYRDNERFDEQIVILNKWLKLAPDNRRPQGELKAAFMALGKDPIEIDRKNWEKNREDITLGCEYVSALERAGRSDEMITVLKELLSYDRYSTRATKKLAETYYNVGELSNAKKSYEELYNLDRSEYNTCIQLSKIYIEDDDNIKALEWAEKALRASGNKAIAYYNRAEVYFEIGQDCSSEELTFYDRVVYEMAFEDYDKATKKGYSLAKTRRDFLEENYITRVTDWFMRPESEKEARLEGDCYGFISRTIGRK